MAIPLSTIKTQLYNWALASSGLAASNVIFAYQNGPEPNGAHVVITPLVAILREGGWDEKVWDGTLATPKYTVYHHRRVQAAINVYGPNAAETLSKIQDGLEVPTRRTALDAAHLAVSCGQIRDLSGLHGALFEERAQMDVFINCTTTSSSDTSIGAFDAVQYSSDADQLDLPETTIST